MSTLWQDLRYALWSLSRVPGLLVVTVVTLGLGIGASSTIFSLLNGFLLRPFPYGDAERLVRIYSHAPAQGDEKMSVSYPDFLDVVAQSQTLAHVSAFRPSDFSLSGGDLPEWVEGGRVSAGLFETFEIRPVAGRLIQPEDDQPGAGKVVVLGEDLWRRRFGADAGLVGKTVELDGEPHTVIGIAPAEFRFPIKGELWVPFAVDPAIFSRGDRLLAVAGLPKAGVSFAAVQAEMAVIGERFAREYPESNEGVGLGVIPFRDFYVDRTRSVLYLLQGAVLFVLLIACTNVANLLLARGAAREREVAVRSAIGATRGRLVRQFLAECFVLALLGGGLGLLLALVGGKALLAGISLDLPAWIQVGVDPRVLLFTLLLSVLTAAVFGIIPALRSSRTDLSSTLKDAAAGSRGGLRRNRLLKSVLVVEVALTVVLLAGSGLMIRSLLSLQSVRSGLDPEGVLTFQIPRLPNGRYQDSAAVSAFYDNVLQRLSTIQGVEAVGADSRLPLRVRGSSEIGFEIEGRPWPENEPGPIANYQVVTPDYFRALEIQLVRGRTFTPQDDADAPGVLLVNRQMAERYWPGQDPVGQRIQISADDEGAWRTVVGVVDDVRHRGLDKEVMLDVYAPHRQLPERAMTVVVRGAVDPGSLTSAAQAAVREVDPQQPIFNVQTMEEVLAASLWLQNLGASVVSVFGSFALLLAALGLYGLMSYSVSQRRQEMGIRMALGAAREDVLRLILRQSLVLVLLGIATGLPLAILLNRFLASMVYGVQPTEALTLAAVCLLLLVVAFAASFLPARRTTRISPVVALQYD